MGNYTQSSRPDDENDDISEQSYTPSMTRRTRPSKNSGHQIDKRAILSAKRKLEHAKSVAHSQAGIKSSSKHHHEKTKSDHVSLSNARASASQHYNTLDG